MPGITGLYKMSNETGVKIGKAMIKRPMARSLGEAMALYRQDQRADEILITLTQLRGVVDRHVKRCAVGQSMLKYTGGGASGTGRG